MPATDEAADSRDSTQTPAPDVVSPKGPADPTPSDTTTTSEGDLQAGAPVESAHTSNGASTAKADGAPSVDVQPEDATNAAGDMGVIFHTGIEWAHLDTTGWPPSAHKALRGLREELSKRPPPLPLSSEPAYPEDDVLMEESAEEPSKPKEGEGNAPQNPPPAAEEAAPPQSRLLSRIAAASAHIPVATGASEDGPGATAAYTQGPFPVIHLSHPTAPLDHIDPGQLAEWDAIPTGKLVAVPFDNNALDPATHSAVASRIRQVVQDVTHLENVGVAAPLRSTAAALSKAHPNAFLIFDLTPIATKMLLDAHVWSSRPITFRVIQLDPTIPFLLFPLAGFTTTDVTTVLRTVHDHWTRPKMAEFFDKIVKASALSEYPLTEDGILAFIASLKVERVDTKSPGGILKPRFNIMADGPSLGDDERWYAVRSYLRDIQYTSNLYGTGTAQDTTHCPICHGADHPRGLCPFPSLPGWNGPAHRPTAQITSPRGPGGQNRWRGTMQGRGRRGRPPPF